MHKSHITATAPWLLVGLLLVIGALLPTLVSAQTHALHVAVYDAAGRGLAEIAVIVRNEAGQELARGATDATGTANFAGLPAIVRVAVEGQARGGPRLFQLGDDARGVRFELGQGAGTLDLRVERDGLVLPDPATMISREEGGPIVGSPSPFPTADLATPALLPTAPAAGGRPTAVDDAQASVPSSPAWVLWATVLIVAFAAGVMLLIQRRRDAR